MCSSDLSPPTSAATAGGLVPVQMGVRQNADTTGSLDVAAEAQNAVATQLTSPDAYVSGKIKILGDPDFLMLETPDSINAVYNSFYRTDGFTINPNGGQIFIEVNFFEGKDYNDNSGLFIRNEDVLFWQYPTQIKQKLKNAISFLLKLAK